MNTQTYIESGVLEAYLLGVANETEQQQVEQYAFEFPEVADALSQLSVTINQHFMAQAIPPPPAIRDRLKYKEDAKEVKKWDFTEQTGNYQTKPKEENTYLEVEYDNTHIKVHKFWRPAFIAVFILSKIFLILAVYFYFKADSLIKENTKLQQEIELKSKH
ncbi:MAG: hypothetical protein ACOVQ4_16300 [Flectobacillus sp.]|uniref:hypothetical protein n=1 Tax=Flectobacillus sp. TaxID=50419 RepID=UPI003B99472D